MGFLKLLLVVCLLPLYSHAGFVEDAHSLHAARDQLAKGEKASAAVHLYKLLTSPYFGRDPDFLAQALPVVFRFYKNTDVLALLAEPILMKGAKKEQTYFDLPIPSSESQRKALSQADAFVVRYLGGRYHAIRSKLVTRLYEEVPETVHSKDLFESWKGKHLRQKMLLTADLARAKRLLARNANEESRDLIEGKKHFEKVCEAQLVRAKAERKLRNYARAREIAEPLLHMCEGDVHKEAFFLIARLAVIEEKSAVLETLDAFIDAYPQDALTLDVLGFKANYAQRHNDELLAQKTRAQIQERFKSPEAGHESKFAEVMELVKAGNKQKALAELQKMRDIKKLSAAQKERVAYWYGRLLYQGTKKQKGQAFLEAFIKESPLSYYAMMASSLLDNFDIREQTLGALESIVPQKCEHPVLQEIQMAYEADLKEESVAFLDRFLPTLQIRKDRECALAILWEAEKAERVYWHMWQWGYSEPRLFAYPKAYQQEIEAAAIRADIPSELLFALVREESYFNSLAVSWAGAMGLGQLMMLTAQKETALCGEEAPSTTQVLDPAFNTRISAQHLKRYTQELGSYFPLGIAAYNVGPQAVRRWLSQLGESVSLDLFIEKIPVAETRAYVKRVLNSWSLYAHYHAGQKISLDREVTLKDDLT